MQSHFIAKIMTLASTINTNKPGLLPGSLLSPNTSEVEGEPSPRIASYVSAPGQGRVTGRKVTVIGHLSSAYLLRLRRQGGAPIGAQLLL